MENDGYYTLPIPIELRDAIEKEAKKASLTPAEYVSRLLRRVLPARRLTGRAATLAAIEEARSGALQDKRPIDVSSVESMLSSMGL